MSRTLFGTKCPKETLMIGYSSSFSPERTDFDRPAFSDRRRDGCNRISLEEITRRLVNHCWTPKDTYNEMEKFLTGFFFFHTIIMSSGSGRRSRSRLGVVDYGKAAKEDPDNFDVHEAQRDYSKDVDLLNLSQDIKDVFKYIQMYYPQKVKIEYRLHPFIPDYLPAVGDADAFIKVIAPDSSIQTGLGLEYLDEPCVNQSDPCLLNLQLRASSSSFSSSKSLVVKKLENAEKNPQVVDQWIRDINELNRGKSSTFYYSKKMPDVETIMEPRTTGTGDAGDGDDRRNKEMPDFENSNLLDVIDSVCDYFEIPKTDTKVEPLHLLFSTYVAIKNSRAQNTTVVLASDNT